MGQWLFKNVENGYPHMYSGIQWACVESVTGDIYTYDSFNYGSINKVDRNTGASTVVSSGLWGNVGGPMGAASGMGTGVSYVNTNGEEEIHFACMRELSQDYNQSGVLIYNTVTQSRVVVNTGWSLNATKTSETSYSRDWSNANNYNSMATFVYDGKVYYFYIMPDNNRNFTLGFYNPANRTYNNIISGGAADSATYFGAAMATAPTMWIKDGYMYIALRHYYDADVVFLKFNLTTSVVTHLTLADQSLVRFGASIFIDGSDVYLLGGRNNGQVFCPNIGKYNITTNTWSDTGVANTFGYAFTAISTQGELFVLTPYVNGGVQNTISKFTFVLGDVAGFTAAYIPGVAPAVSRIQLNWADSTEESFYVIEKKTDSGAWSLLAQVPANTVQYIDSDNIDLTGHKYSYRIKAAKVVVL